MRFNRFECQTLVLDILATAARAGQPCPTNAQMALDIGAGSDSSLTQIMRDMRLNGSIKIHKQGNDRIVEIPSLGLFTAPKPRKTYTGNVVLKFMELESLQYVSRDPCFRCGVRADIGCEHTRVAA